MIYSQNPSVSTNLNGTGNIHVNASGVNLAENISYSNKSNYKTGFDVGIKTETGLGFSYSDLLSDSSSINITPFAHIYIRAFIPNLSQISSGYENIIAGSPALITGGLLGSELNINYKDLSFGIRGGLLISPNLYSLIGNSSYSQEKLSLGGVISGNLTYFIPNQNIGLRLGISMSKFLTT